MPLGGDGTHAITHDLAYQRHAIVNVVFWGRPGAGDREWVLIDAGLMGSRAAIEAAAEARFGKGSRPAAIVLTHGHFDHVGVLEDLAEAWDAPVWAHPLEHPYLDGSAAFPPASPAVGGVSSPGSRRSSRASPWMSARGSGRCRRTAPCRRCPVGDGSMCPAIRSAKWPCGARRIAA